MKIVRLVALGAMFAVSAGCAGGSQAALKQETGKRGEIYSEIARGGGAPEGYADLTVTASIKTHSRRASLLPDSHGSDSYVLLVYVDGQPVAMTGQARPEKREGSPFTDPEAGKGVRYLFTGTLRLQAGTHQVRVSLPQDSVGVTRDITLANRSENRLTLQPVYGTFGGRQRLGFYGVTSFKEGISRLRFALNGKVL